MMHMVNVTDEDINQLETMLHKEIAESRVELRRTRNQNFRENIRRRVAMVEHLLETLANAKKHEPSNVPA